MEFRTGSVGRATMFIVVSALSFGSISVLTVLNTATGTPLVTAMTWRYLLAALLLCLSPQLRLLRSIPPRKILQLLLIGGLGQALITYLSLHALDYISVGPLAFLFYTYPAWVALLAAIRRTEPLTPLRIVALMLALGGVTIMVGAPTERLNPIGVALALISALLYSAYLPALERVQRGIPALISSFLLIIGATAGFLVSAIFAREMFVPSGLAVWTNLFLLAFVSTVIAFSFLIKGLAVLGPVRTAIIATVEPFFTAVLGVLILRNEPRISTLIGGVLIAGAVMVIEWSSARAATVQQQRVAVAQSR